MRVVGGWVRKFTANIETLVWPVPLTHNTSETVRLQVADSTDRTIA